MASANRNPVWCENSAGRLRSPPFVVVENSAQPFMALNSRIHVDHTVRLLDQPIVEPLVIPLEVVMLRVLPHSVAQMLLSQRDDLGQALGLAGANESLRVGIQIRASCGKLHCFDA